MCILGNINYSKEVIRTEELPCGMKITKRLCLTTTTFNQKEESDFLQSLTLKKIYTDEDIFLKDIDKHKVWFLYQPLQDGGTLKIDDFSILGRNTYIGKNEIVSENEIKKDTYAPIDNCNFEAFHKFVLENKLQFKEFIFHYENSIFEIKYLPQDEENNVEEQSLLKVENVGKAYTYPFVLYFLKKSQDENESEKVIQNFKVTQGYLG